MNRIDMERFSLIIKTLILGIFVGGIILLYAAIMSRFVESNSQLNNILHWDVIIAHFILVICIIMLIILNKKVELVFKSKRFDFLLIFLLGMLFVYIFRAFLFNQLMPYIPNNPWLTVIIIIPIFVAVSAAITEAYLINRYKNIFDKQSENIFVSDAAEENIGYDIFELSNQVKVFSESVYNNGLLDSIVFGLEAPWGTGKTSFMNFCKKYWEKNYKNKIIVYNFNILCYEKREDLLRKFTQGLIITIKKEIFHPDLECSIIRYTQFLNNTKSSFSFSGLGVSFSKSDESLEDIIVRLDNILKNIDRKIIVIIDDLDRVDFSDVAEIFYLMNKVFNLSNISFIICYDSDNFDSLCHHNRVNREKLNEFLEKFINVKTSIYVNSGSLLKFFISNKNSVTSENLLVNPGMIVKIVNGMENIFKSADFDKYMPFIGDVRKIKRLMNTVHLLEPPNNNLRNFDFDDDDLTHLLLIHLNYPNIFRKIYICETDGRYGSFSVVRNEKGSKNNSNAEYKASDYYEDYKKKLNSSQAFLLNKVFCRFTEQDENKLQTLACFNGNGLGGKRNLEAYLNLIVKMKKPLEETQYNYYLEYRNRILNGELPKKIFNDEDFISSEYKQSQLWNMLVNTDAREYNKDVAENVVSFAINNLENYSLVAFKEQLTKLRYHMSLNLVMLLDKVGWRYEADGIISDKDESILKIAYMIFGENIYENEGIIDILGNEKRGLLGLYDLLVFRMNCSIDRHYEIPNLSRALIKYDDLKARTDGLLNELKIPEMRKLSQKVYEIFKAQYIDEKRNIFREIESLTIKNFIGTNSNNISGMKEINIEDVTDTLKFELKAFMIYQLGSKEHEYGVGCGYYGISGKDDNGQIHLDFNKYLFDICFESNSHDGYKFFVEYLLIVCTQSTSFMFREKYLPVIDDFTRILNKDMLISYWKENGNSIKSREFTEQDFSISNRRITKGLINSIYELLDKESKFTDNIKS